MTSFSTSAALACLGALVALRLAYSFLSFVYINLRPASFTRYRHSNGYALITGASDGIGLGFAQELLSHGFNVILHGRNESKLKGIQSDLSKQCPGRDVRYYVADGAKTGEESWKQMDVMLEQVKDLPITMLVNNVGGMAGVDPLFDSLEMRTPAQVEHNITLNSTYPTQMARALLPILRKNEPSLIMNISSLAGVIPLPFLSIYNGAKAYLAHWSHSLSVEMRTMGARVEVILIEVGPVNTPGNPNTSTTNFFTPSARNMAKGALQQVGCGKWKVVGYWPHALQKNGFCWLPEPLMEMACVLMSKHMKKQQDEKLKKGK